MSVLFVAGCALAGLVAGTLLTVVVELVPRRESVAPAMVRLLRRGGRPPRSERSRSPVVPLATAGLFAAAALRFGADWVLPAFLVFFAALLAVAVIDLEHYIVPNRIIAWTLAVSLPLLAAAALLADRWDSLGRALIGAVAAGAGLLVINLVSPRGMGMGDVKLALVLGLHLGWLGLAHVVLGLFLGFLLGAVGGVALIALGVRKRSDHVPFAPFLAGGAVLAVLVGRPVLTWYLG
ncbi:MAG: A24 family peptidase [Actinomycetota bacterium]|nr:A24 family peptidase [Actinomycetota bacterium]